MCIFGETKPLYAKSRAFVHYLMENKVRKPIAIYHHGNIQTSRKKHFSYISNGNSKNCVKEKTLIIFLVIYIFFQMEIYLYIYIYIYIFIYKMYMHITNTLRQTL